MTRRRYSSRIARARRAGLKRIEHLKVEIFLALTAGDEDRAAAAHDELVDRLHEAMMIEDVRRVAAKVRRA